MDIMTHAKFYFSRLMLTLIFAIRASEPPQAWQTTEKAGPDRVKWEFLRVWECFAPFPGIRPYSSPRGRELDKKLPGWPGFARSKFFPGGCPRGTSEI